jgi:predicted DNA-binding transcriptional regulator YafY
MRDEDLEPTGMQSSALRRQWLLLQLIPPHPAKSTLKTLHEGMARGGEAVDKRTVERLIKCLAEDGWPIEIDKRTKPYGVRWEKNAHPLTVPGLTLAQASCFSFAEKYLKEGLGPAYIEELSPFFKMANSLLLQKGGNNWVEKTRFLQRRQPIPPPVIDSQVVACIQEAVQGCVPLQFQYLHLRDGKTQVYRVFPLGLIIREQVTFLVAEILPSRVRRTFKLHRISDVAQTIETTVAPSDFNIDDFVKKQGLEDVDPPVIDLEVMFYDHEGDFLLERPVPEGWNYDKLAGGEVRWKARLPETRQLRMWLQHFGSSVEIIKPENLRIRMVEQALAMSRRYGCYSDSD